MRGAGSKDILNSSPRHNDLINYMWSPSDTHDCTTWADISVTVPLACLGSTEGTPPLKPPSLSDNTITDVHALPSSSHDIVAGSPGDLQTFAGDQPSDATCTVTLSPASGSPAEYSPPLPPPQPVAPYAPALPLHHPCRAEPQSMSDPQHTAEACIPPGAVGTPIQGPVWLAAAPESPNTPLQQMLPRMPAAPKAYKPRRGFSQRNRVRTSVFDGTSCV